MATEIRNIGIVGAGKLGTSLTLALLKLKKLSWVCVHTESQKQTLENLISSSVPVYISIDEIESIPDTIFITVDDKNIKPVAEYLSLKYQNKLADKLIVHCSGSVPKEALDLCTTFGAKTAVAHPYQTFFEPSEKLFEGICWTVNKDDNLELIKPIISLLGGKAFPINLDDEKTRGLYHSSAVVASNYTNLLLNLAKSIIGSVGLPAEEFLIPIIKTTIENNIKSFKENSEIPITGPLVRGDLKAVKLHLESMKDNFGFREAYWHLTLTAAVLAKESNILTNEEFIEILELLKE